jgi:hypothetical protein
LPFILPSPLLTPSTPASASQCRTFDNFAGWLDDPEAFRAGMAAIHSGAASLIDAIEVAMVDAEEVRLAA